MDDHQFESAMEMIDGRDVEIEDLRASCRKVMEGLSESMKESEALRFEVARLTTAKRHFSALADAKGKENVEFRQLLRDARDHVPWDVLKRIDAALGASRAEQTSRENGT